MHTDDQSFVVLTQEAPDEPTGALACIQRAEKYIQEILDLLFAINPPSSQTEEFDDITSILYKIVAEKTTRLQYNVITDHVFSKIMPLSQQERDEEIERICYTIVLLGDNLLERVESEEDNGTQQLDVSNSRKAFNIVMKLYDHTKLANIQFARTAAASENAMTEIARISNQSINQLQQFQSRIKKEIDEKSEQIDEIKQKTGTIYSDLISIVAIFTGIAFLLFGGVSALAGLREALLVDTYSGFLKTLSFASLICAAIDGGLYMLFRFIMSITGRLQERETLAWFAKTAFFWLLGLSLFFAILSVVVLNFDSQVWVHNKILEKRFG